MARWVLAAALLALCARSARGSLASGGPGFATDQRAIRDITGIVTRPCAFFVSVCARRSCPRSAAA